MDVFVADLSAQSQVRRLAAEILQRLPRIDVLVNNVGGYWNTRHVTADGLERTFALNHLAPFLLTNLLLDRLQQSAPARVVTVVLQRARARAGSTSTTSRANGPTPGARAYNQSKLANVLFTYELARQAPGHLGHRQRPASRGGAHLLRGRGPRPASSGCSSRSCGRS